MARRHGKQTVVYMDGVDVSGDSNGLDVDATYDEAEVSAFGDEHKWRILGQVGGKVQHRAWFDTGGSAIHQLLVSKIGGTAGIVFNASYGTAQGDFGWGGAGQLVSSYQPNAPLSGAIGLTSNYMFSQYLDMVQVQAAKANIGTAGSAYDGSAGSNAGAVGYLQQFNVLGGTPTFIIEHSTTGTSSWATLLSFAAGTAVGGQRVEVSGTVRQFTRINVSGGSALAAAYFKRI